MSLSLGMTLSVSELNDYASNLLKNDPLLKNVRVKGEISGFKVYSASGHWYFSLKDSSAKVDCAMFRTYNIRSGFVPKEGTKVILTGYVDLYARDGRYQMIVTAIRPDGVGDLYQQFEDLKNRLKSEGLFDLSRKKQLPLLPRKIAVITSASGAVYHDIRNVAYHRNPAVPIVLIPSAVQGAGAEYELCEGIHIAEKIKNVDLIIIGRGGGSMEDLWCFNSEILARTIADCHIPVVSAVGHETDFTICDFVADQRASTPSNAAEIAVPTLDELISTCNVLNSKLNTLVLSAINDVRLQIFKVNRRIERVHPLQNVKSRWLKCEQLHGRMNHAMQKQFDSSRHITYLTEMQLISGIERKLEHEEQHIRNLKDRLYALSPYGVLKRGYAIVTDEKEQVLSSVKDSIGIERMKILFSDGKIKVRKEDDA